MKLGKDYIPSGLLADTAIQCRHPETGETGSFLYVGSMDSPVSPCLPDLYALHQWCMANGWRSIGPRYIFEP